MVINIILYKCKMQQSKKLSLRLPFVGCKVPYFSDYFDIQITKDLKNVHQCPRSYADVYSSKQFLFSFLSWTNVHHLVINIQNSLSQPYNKVDVNKARFISETCSLLKMKYVSITFGGS